MLRLQATAVPRDVECRTIALRVKLEVANLTLGSELLRHVAGRMHLDAGWRVQAESPAGRIQIVAAEVSHRAAPEIPVIPPGNRSVR